MKSSKAFVVVTIVISALIVFWAVANVGAPNQAANPSFEDGQVVLYKDPSCGCCEVYASYLKKEGVEATTVEVANMGEVKMNFGIPDYLQSCHTMEVGGYVVEGHVPLSVVTKLLTEKPAIKGISLPGMPSGSPGMPGPKMSPFVIYVIGGGEGEIYTAI